MERNWVVWPFLSLTISCLAFVHSPSLTKFLQWSPRRSPETIRSWNLHAKSRLLKGGVRITMISKHTLHPVQKSPCPSRSSRALERKPQHILAVLQVLFLKTSSLHKHTHIFLITYNILFSTHSLLTSFIYLTQSLNMQVICVPISEQNWQASTLTKATV